MTARILPEDECAITDSVFQFPVLVLCIHIVAVLIQEPYMLPQSQLLWSESVYDS